MDNDWGLTSKGFRRPNYVELLNALEYKARELFGDKVNLTIRSPLGLFLRVLAWIWNILFSCLEDVYNSRFVDTAIGHSLYNLGRNIGVQILSEEKATGYITVSGDPDTLIPSGFLVSTNSGLQYTTVNPVKIPDSGKALAIIRAVQTGPEYNTSAGTVQVIVNPSAVSGLRSVTNDADIAGGRTKETDAEFRQRYYESVDYAGGVNADAIQAALLNDVGGISSAFVYENDTDEHNDAYDLPPHSIEAVVYGGLDEDIARAIYARRSAGIQTVGNTAVSVITASGQELTINFSRPMPVKIWIKVCIIKKGSGYQGDDAVRAALIEYIGEGTSGGLDIGIDVIYIKLPGVITAAVSGIEDFEISISTDGQTYEKSNVEIGYREKAVTEESAVIVE
ncbi:MAG: hypothetical protein HFG54_14275 [Lachnospiraceae bacterium]|jgi:uncharacterized phage protein gp47/JayE|nr:hypothetical protein [Lachnospiraceae bacterium]